MPKKKEPATSEIIGNSIITSTQLSSFKSTADLIAFVTSGKLPTKKFSNPMTKNLKRKDMSGFKIQSEEQLAEFNPSIYQWLREHNPQAIVKFFYEEETV